MKGLVWISGLALAVVMCTVFALTRPAKAQIVRCFNSCTSARAFADNTCASYNGVSCHITAWGCGVNGSGQGSYSWGCTCINGGTGGNGSIDPSCGGF